MKRFENKVVLVTGGASGIGRACALRFAEEGASIFVADVQAAALDATAKDARELGAHCETAILDVTDEDAVREAVANCLARFGHLDVVCNVAGILRFDHTHELSLSDWSRVLGV